MHGSHPAFSEQWINDDLANKIIQQYIEQNWEVIRLALARDREYEIMFDTSKKAGEGFYNSSIYTSQPRKAIKGETSWVQLVIRLDDRTDEPYILTAYPTKKFPERGSK